MTNVTTVVPRVQPGRVVCTPAAIEASREHDINLAELLVRHCAGDWGDVDPDAARANEAALLDGSRVLSVYNVPDTGTAIWILSDGATDACRACLANIGTCEPEKGEWLHDRHFRTDIPMQRVFTTIMLPADY